MQNGFRTVGFNVGSEKINGRVLTVGYDEEKTVVPIEDNRYELNLSCDEVVYKTLSYVYGATVKLSDLPAPEKLGYVISSWEEQRSDFIIHDDVTLSAVTVLADTDIKITGNELIYNGTEQTVKPILKHDLTVTYTTCWDRLGSSGWEKFSDGTAR